VDPSRDPITLPGDRRRPTWTFDALVLAAVFALGVALGIAAKAVLG